MKDLVERLKVTCCHCDTTVERDTAEASDEITRLRALNAELVEALEACLKLEQRKARNRELSDCCCVAWSSNTERLYERGECPHQIARTALIRAKGEV